MARTKQHNTNTAAGMKTRSTRSGHMILAALTSSLLVATSAGLHHVAVASTDTVDVPKRFTFTDRGDMRVIGNTLLTCRSTPSYAASCADAQNASGNGLNDKFNMIYVDIDQEPATFNASRATLDIPAGARVAFAGLYWGANLTGGIGGQPAPAPNDRTTAWLRIPGAVGYVPVTGALVGSDETTGQSRSYGVFADVTSLARERGEYWVANVQSGTGVRDDAGASGGLFAGWGLVVVYQDKTQPLRSFNVWDAYFRVAENTTGQMQVDEFVTPLTGAFRSVISTIAFEGDKGLSGDSLRLMNTSLTNGANPLSNIFNGTVSSFGAQAARAPSYANQLGIDVDTIDASGVIPNGANVADITLPTTADNYFPAMVALAIDVFEPKLEMDKSYYDINGGTVNPGDVLRYTVVLTNTGVDTATKVVINDVIPAGTTYVPGTLRITEDPGGATGQKTDARDADTAEFDGAGNRVRFYVGGGATGLQGGWVPVGARATVEFCVTINPLIADGTRVLNTAVANYSGSVISATWNITADDSVETPVYVPDLSITKTDGGRTAAPGDTVIYRIDARNLSNYAQATNVVLTETLPLYTTFAGPSTWVNVPGTRQYMRTIGTMYPASGQVVTFAVKLDDTIPAAVTELENVVVIADTMSSVPERNLDNNTGRDSTPIFYADISADKTDGKTAARVGDYLTYAFTVTNNGPVRVTGVQISDPIFHGAIQPTWTCTAGPGGICGAASGTGALTTTADLASGGYVVYRIAVLVGFCDGLLINRATAFAPNVPDPVPGNNITVDVNNDGDGANLYVYPEFGTLIAGELTTYTIPIINYGPDVATNVTATFKLPPGMTLNQFMILGNTTGATYDAQTGVWSIGTLQVGSGMTLTIGGYVTTSLSVGQVLTSVLNVDSLAMGNAPIRQYITTTVQPKIEIAGPRLMTLFLPVTAR